MGKEQLAELKASCGSNNRVCPVPDRWDELWEMLPNKTRVGGGWEPPLPLILGAWSFTSNLEKIIRLNEHLNYSLESGCLDKVGKFLHSLSEEEWHHLGD